MIQIDQINSHLRIIHNCKIISVKWQILSKTGQQNQLVSISEKIGGTIHKDGPLKPKIDAATRLLNQPISKLNATAKKLAEKDTRLFQRIVDAQQSHDTRKAQILANELSEIRKHEKVVSNIKLSFEQVQMRLSTVTELGDMMSMLGPVMSTMKSMGPALGRFMPEADAEFASMGDTLGGLISNSFEGSFENDVGYSEETESILQEASVVAGNQIGEKFPSVPATISSGISQTAEQY